MTDFRKPAEDGKFWDCYGVHLESRSLTKPSEASFARKDRWHVDENRYLPHGGRQG